MADPNPFADLPSAIVDLLRDEANLSSATHVLEDARQDALNRRDAARAQRPAFGIIGSKKQREDYAQTIASLEAQLVAIDSMMNRVTSARDRVQPWLRAALAQHLNHADPLYRQGFRASRFQEHWRRAHAIVADRMRGFIRDTRETRNAVSKDVQKNRAIYSGESLWHFGNLKKAAIELDREVDALNRVAGDFAAAVYDTPFAIIRFPNADAPGCSQIIDTLTLRPAAAGLAEIEALLAEFTEARQSQLTELMSAFESAASEHDQLAEARLRQYWSGLLMQAEACLVSDAELEPTLNDIERRQAEQARRRLDDQVIRPFDTER